MVDVVIVGIWFFDIDGSYRIEYILDSYKPDAIVVMAPEDLVQDMVIESPSEFEQRAGLKNFLTMYPLDLDRKQIATLKQTITIFYNLARYEYRTVNDWVKKNDARIECADISLSRLRSVVGDADQVLQFGAGMFLNDDFFIEAYLSVLSQGAEAFIRAVRDGTENIYQMREDFKQAELAWRHPNFQDQMNSIIPHAVMKTVLACYNSERCERVGSAIKELYLDNYKRILVFVPLPSLWMVFSELTNIFNPRVFTLNQFRSIAAQ